MAWLAGLSLAGSAVATAHPQFGPATINRYARWVLTAPDRARVFYTVMVGDIPALSLRQSVDADRSGDLDAAEQAALQAKLAALVQQGLVVQAGPDRVPLTWESAQLALGDATVSARALSFDATAVSQPLSVPSAEVLWRYQDHVPLAPEGEVELRVEEAPGIWLRASRGPARPEPAAPAAPGSPQASPAGAAPARLFQVVGPLAPGSHLQVELEVAGPARAHAGPVPQKDRRALRLGLAGIVGLLVLALAAARAAARRAR